MKRSIITIRDRHLGSVVRLHSRRPGMAATVANKSPMVPLWTASSPHYLPARWWSSTSYHGGSKLSQTSVFFQSGLKISELPLVVKKVRNVLEIPDCGGTVSASVAESKEASEPDDAAIGEEAQEMIAGLKRCSTQAEVFKLLETIPVGEVTPAVAIEALGIVLEPKFPTGRSSSLQVAEPNESFLGLAFISMLLNIVYSSRNPRTIIQGLQMVAGHAGQGPGHQQAGGAVRKELVGQFTGKLHEKTLLLVTEGVFSLAELSQVVAAFNRLENKSIKASSGLGVNREDTAADRLWAAILDKSERGCELDETTMAKVFGTLPHLRSSRGVVLELLQTKVGDFWQKYSTRDVLEMLRVLVEIRVSLVGTPVLRRILKVISQWTSANVHLLNEAQLLALVCCFSRLEYIDDTFVTTLERYLKARGLRVKEADLVAAVCDYCLDHRVRSVPILDCVSEYVLAFGRTMTAPQLRSSTRVFGELDRHPANGFRFWEALEPALEQRFSEMAPLDAVDLLLSFVYLERFPLNFVPKVFNPYFVDRLLNPSLPAPVRENDGGLLHDDDDGWGLRASSLSAAKLIGKARAQLKLFDAAMNLEAPYYSGPHLPKETRYRQVEADLRVMRMVNGLVETLGQVVGDVRRVGKSVVLSSLPLHPLYVVDLMIYPTVAASLLRFGFRTNSNNSRIIAVICHTPEHYDRTGQHLVGPQVMRVRHLKKMNFRVMQINYSKVHTLMKLNPEELKAYLSEQYQKAIVSGGKED